MTIYVDNARLLYKGKFRHHMISTVSRDDLIMFASTIGVKMCWLDSQKGGILHYDITSPQRLAAIENGAIAVSSAELVRKYNEAYRR